MFIVVHHTRELLANGNLVERALVDNTKLCLFLFLWFCLPLLLHAYSVITVPVSVC